MKKKIILAGLIAAVIGGIGVWYFVFYKPTHFKRDVADEQAISVTAVKIVGDFLANEDSANKVYLNKAIAITGEVIEAKKNQDGKPTVTLKSNDSFSNIYCTLKDDAGQIQGGTTITVKGICTGFLSDVVIIDAIIVKP
jgi:tRNA_anti-like